MTDPKNASLSKKDKFIKEAKSLALIAFVIFAFRSTFFEPFRIPSGSMIPTLMIGDFILVNKFAYGVKLPYSDMFGDPYYLSTPKPPLRGDVIVFKYPKDESLNFIKRVVGLPGDVIEVRDNLVYINDNPVSVTNVDGKKYMSDMDDEYVNRPLKFFEQTLDKKKHIYQIDEAREGGLAQERFTVPEGHFFVMGDNRDYSSDSRVWGLVPFGNIKGRALLVWFSFILPFSDHDMKLRLHRIGTMIE